MLKKHHGTLATANHVGPFHLLSIIINYMLNINQYLKHTMLVLLDIGELQKDFNSATFLTSGANFHTSFLKAVVNVKASRLPNNIQLSMVISEIIWINKGMHLSMEAADFYAANVTTIQMRINWPPSIY